MVAIVKSIQPLSGPFTFSIPARGTLERANCLIFSGWLFCVFILGDMGPYLPTWVLAFTPLVLVLPNQLFDNVIVAVKVKAGLLVVETPAGIALIKDIQCICQGNVEALGHFNHDTTYPVPSDYVAYLPMLFCAHNAITSLKERYFSMTS